MYSHKKAKPSCKINEKRKPSPNFVTFCSKSLHSNKASPVEVNPTLTNCASGSKGEACCSTGGGGGEGRKRST